MADRHWDDALDLFLTHAGAEKGLAVETGDGVLVIRRLQPAGKRVMDAGDFIRGHKVAVGSVMGWTEAAVRP